MVRNYRVVERTIDGKKYRCVDPLCCLSPIPTKVSKIICNTEEYVIAKIYYRNSKTSSFGFRWNITDYEREHYGNKNDLCLGYPNTRGYATWFILPEEFRDFLTFYKKK